MTAFDYGVWKMIIEAPSEADALERAKNIYILDGFGSTDAFEPIAKDVTWKAELLVAEVQR